MKIFTTCFALLVFMQPLMAQLDSTEVQFIHDLMRKYQRVGTLYYGSTSSDDRLKKEIKTLSLSKQLITNARKDSIWLTAKERMYLLRELRKPSITQFADSLFPNSQRMNSDSLFTFLRRKNKQVYDSLLATQGIELAVKYFNSTSAYVSFHFSRPIYIRKRTIMLFHFMWFTYAAGGETYLTFHRKENGQWEKWITVDGGAW